MFDLSPLSMERVARVTNHLGNLRYKSYNGNEISMKEEDGEMYLVSKSDTKDDDRHYQHCMESRENLEAGKRKAEKTGGMVRDMSFDMHSYEQIVYETGGKVDPMAGKGTKQDLKREFLKRDHMRHFVIDRSDVKEPVIIVDIGQRFRGGDHYRGGV